MRILRFCVIVATAVLVAFESRGQSTPALSGYWQCGDSAGLLSCEEDAGIQLTEEWSSSAVDVGRSEKGSAQVTTGAEEHAAVFHVACGLSSYSITSAAADGDRAFCFANGEGFSGHTPLCGYAGFSLFTFSGSNFSKSPGGRVLSSEGALASPVSSSPHVKRRDGLRRSGGSAGRADALDGAGSGQRPTPYSGGGLPISLSPDDILRKQVSDYFCGDDADSRMLPFSP